MWWLLALIPIAVLIWIFRPVPYTVHSSRRIANPRAEVFAKIRDLHSWREWSPWLISEPGSTPANETITDVYITVRATPLKAIDPLGNQPSGSKS